MNEQAIQDAYKLFVENGYSKSIDEFKVLMKGNNNAREDMYKLFVNQGYRKSKEDFGVLMGVSSKTPPVKKKDDSELLGEDGSSGSAEIKTLPTDREELKELLSRKPPVVGQDTGEDFYRNPMKSIGMYPSQEQVDGAIQQQFADFQKTAEVAEQDAPFLSKRQEEEEDAARVANETLIVDREAALKTEDFQAALAATDAKSMEMDEEDAISYFTNLYGKYGFVFREVGMGDAMEVIATDGSTKTIDLQTIMSNDKEASALRSFVKGNAHAAADVPENQDEITNAVRANNLRKTPRLNDDGTESTVKFQSANIDGREVVYPTLFPDADGDFYGSDPSWWKELDGVEAYEEAVKRGEVFYFDDPEKAAEFSEGSWKSINRVDGEANKFYKDRGLDYGSYKKMHDRYEEVMSTISAIEDSPYYKKDLSAEEQEKLGYLYVNGRKRSDREAILKELNEEADELRPQVNQDEFQRVREDFDLVLDKQYRKQSKIAAYKGQEADAIMDDVDVKSLQQFGVPAKDITKIVPKTDLEKELIRGINEEYQSAANNQKLAADAYQVSRTWLDAKVDKQARDAYVDDWSSVSNAWEGGLANGKVGNMILALSLGIEDVDSDSSTEEVASKIIEYMKQAQTGKTGRTQRRWHNARGFQEAFDVFKDNPAELALTLAAQSMSQMLPYGYKLIIGGTAAGAGTGAVYGSVVPGAGTAAGAVGGAGYGFRTGFASTMVALEYTNAVMDAARKRYNVMNPEELAMALQDKEVWDEGREIGLKRGLTIGAVDFFAMGLAGRVFKTGLLASRTARVAAVGAERVVFDPIAEGVGEALAQVVAGQELDGKEIAAEMIGGLGNNTPMAAYNVFMDNQATTKLDIANTMMSLDGFSTLNYSDKRIMNFANNMETLGQLTPEQNQLIQENIGLRREARSLMGIGGNKITDALMSQSSPAIEARLSKLLAARNELSSTPNRKQVFSQKIKDINTEISDIVTNKKLRPDEQQVLLAGEGVIGVQEQQSGSDIRTGVKKYAINGKTFTREAFLAELEKLNNKKLLKSAIQVDNDEEAFEEVDKRITAAENETSNKPVTTPKKIVMNDEGVLVEEQVDIVNNENTQDNAIQESSTESVDAQEQTQDSETLGERVQTEGQIAEEVTSQEEVIAEEVTPELEQEVNDLKNMLEPDSKKQFQLDDTTITPERKKKLEKRATELMEEIQPELSEKSFVVEETSVTPTPVVVTENKELESKVPKMKVQDLEGKRINLVMADQLKVDEKRMGGPFFPLQEGVYGKQIAWASISVDAAREIIKGSIGADYAIVYNMSPSAVDSNVVLLDSLIEKVEESENSEAIFEAMMEDLSNKKFGGKTDIVNAIAQRSQTLEEFKGLFMELDVDTKAAIFKAVLPLANVEAGTKVGKLFAAEGVTQESLRAENVEQFASDLPMGSMTMVLKITDKNGNPITKENIDDAIVTQEQQKAEGIKTHKNYPVYIRGEAVAMMENTVPFWSVNKNALSTINAKVDGIVKKKVAAKIDKKTGEVKAEATTRNTTASEARSAEMRRASMKAGTNFEVTEATKTNYERFITKLTKSFPNTEVVTSQEAFDELTSELNAQKLMTKNQKVYGAVYNGKLYLNPALENYDTPVHEFGHLWLNTAKALTPETYEKGLSLVKGTQYESDVRNSKSYKKVIKQMIADGATESEIEAYILEEALATAIGNKGASFATAAQKKNFKAWLEQLFDFVKKLTGISKLSAEQIQDLSLDEFTEAVVVDLLSENKAFKEAESAVLSDALQLSLAPDTSPDAIVRMAREQGFTDDAIRVVLKDRGLSATRISEAIKVQRDLMTTMPKEFGNVEGGATVGLELFNEIKDGVQSFSTEGPRGGRGTTRTKTFGEIRAKAQELLVESRVYKRQDSQIQMEMRVALDRQLGIRNNPQVTREIGAIRNALKQRKIGKDNITEAQRRLRNFIRKALPDSKNYRRKSINKLLSIINSTTPTNFQGQAVKVLESVQEQRQIMKNELVKKMAKMIASKSKTKRTASGKRRSAGLDAIGQGYFKAADNILKMVLKNDLEGLQQMQLAINEEQYNEIAAKIEAGEKVTMRERAIYDTQLALDTFSDVMNMELEQVNELFAEVKNTRRESLARLNNRREARRAETNAIKEEFESQILNDFDVLFDDNGNPLSDIVIETRREAIMLAYKESGFKAGLSEFLNQFMDNSKLNANSISRFMRNTVGHLGTMTRTLDKYSNGMFTKIFYDQLNEFDENNLQGVRETESRMDSMANDTTGKTWSKWKYSLGTNVVKYDFTDTEHNNLFSKGIGTDQAMYLYALSLNDVQRKKLEAQNVDIEKIKKQIGPDNQALVEQTVEFLSNDYFEQTNAVYVQANDVNLGYVENYFPVQTINKSDITSEMIGSGEFGKVFSAEYAPALKERTNKNQDVKIGLSFSEVMEEHVKSMEKYKAYALGVKQMNEILKSQSIQNVLNSTGLKNLFKTSLNYAINPDSGPRVENDIVSKSQGAFTGFALALKIVQIPKQMASFIQAFEQYSATKENNNIPGLDLAMFMYDYAKVLVMLRTNLKEAREVSATFDNRIKKGLEGDIFGLESGNRTFKKIKAQQGRLGRGQRALNKTLGFTTVAGDILGVLGYKALYNRNIANGMSKAEALRLFNDFNATQQTRRATEKSQMQQSSNVFARFFTMFGSSLYLMMNNVSQSGMSIGVDIMNKKVPKKADLRKFVLNYSVANVLFTAAAYSPALLFAKSDAEKDRAYRALRDAALGLNLLYQIPFIGAGLESLRDTLDGKRSMASDGVNPFTSVIGKVRKGVKEDGLVVGMLRPLAEIFARFQFDTPIALVKLLTGNADAIEGDYYDLFGVSKSYRPGYGTQTKKSNTKKGGGVKKSSIKKYQPDLYDKLYGPNSATAKQKARIKKLKEKYKQ